MDSSEDLRALLWKHWRGRQAGRPGTGPALTVFTQIPGTRLMDQKQSDNWGPEIRQHSGTKSRTKSGRQPALRENSGTCGQVCPGVPRCAQVCPAARRVPGTQKTLLKDSVDAGMKEPVEEGSPEPRAGQRRAQGAPGSGCPGI
ncbi:uncharacterized protein LOC144245738 [Crocuta crocuta]